MSSSPIAPCSHELRPGTTVCLHCRGARRAASGARARRTVALLLVAAGAVAGGVAVANGRGAALGRAPAPTVARAATPERASPAPARTAAVTAAPTRPATPVTTASGPAVAAPATTPTTLPPLIAEGRTSLKNGVFVVRQGGVVTVHFDTPTVRTRRAEKFEQVVRATLPKVYGPSADSILGMIPSGDLARGGDLLTELPARGLRLEHGGSAVVVWPETRAGRDGPLVVAYRTTGAP